MTYAFSIYKSKFKKLHPTAKIAGYKKNEELWEELDRVLLEHSIPVPDFFDFVFEYTEKPYPNKLFKKTANGKSFLLVNKYLAYKDDNLTSTEEITDDDFNQTYQDIYIKTGIAFMELTIRKKELKRDTSFTVILNNLSPVYTVYLMECGIYCPELNDYEQKAYKSIKNILLPRYESFINEIRNTKTEDLETRYLSLYKKADALVRLAPEIQVNFLGSIGTGVLP